jgi:small subunit ribosomal protein S5
MSDVQERQGENQAAGGRSGQSRPEGRGRRDRDRGRDRDRDPADREVVEKLVKLNRTAKVVKGGRRFSVSALTVVGDRKGKVGFGFGKANDVSEAIRKSIDKAKRSLIELPVKNGTIPHEVNGYFKASQVLLKPACSGTGIIAGGPVRAIMEAGGVTDVLSKSIGASSQYNVLKATFDGISRLLNAKQIAANRGKTLKDMWG